MAVDRHAAGTVGVDMSAIEMGVIHPNLLHYNITHVYRNSDRLPVTRVPESGPGTSPRPGLAELAS
jgi:hypothetical protein